MQTLILGYPLPVLMGQLVIGIINGAFYAMLSLGVSIIFGMLRIANFAHGAQFAAGAIIAWAMLNLPALLPHSGLPALGYWVAIFTVPIIVFGIGALTERVFIRQVYDLDHAFGLLLTVGITMFMEGIFDLMIGSSGRPYPVPDALKGVYNLGFMILPVYRLWVIVLSVIICFATWYAIERTRIGGYLRAATENPEMVRAFGINVPLLMLLTYAVGVGLAGLAGVLAAPIYQVSPRMGSTMIIVVFAIVVIGGMGSILGSIITGFVLGMVEGLTKLIYPEASAVVVFVVMAAILLLRPAGLMGRQS